VPALTLGESSLSYSAPSGGTAQTNSVQVSNSAGGLLQWTASVAYTNGGGWLTVSPSEGQNNGSIQVVANPGTLAPGTYQATLTVNAGPLAGTKTVAISFVITTPTIQPPTITSAVNAATFASGPLAPGSIASLFGTQFSGQNLSVTFNNVPSQVFFSNATQINLLVPATLGNATSAQVMAVVDGNASTPFTVSLAPFAPGIFNNGILNQDNTVNSSAHPAAPGTVIQIFATGLSGMGAITAKIGSVSVTQPYYAGPAPGFLGLQQVDLLLPTSLSGNSVNVSVCGGATAAQMVCSPSVAVVLSKYMNPL